MAPSRSTVVTSPSRCEPLLRSRNCSRLLPGSSGGSVLSLASGNMLRAPFFASAAASGPPAPRQRHRGAFGLAVVAHHAARGELHICPIAGSACSATTRQVSGQSMLNPNGTLCSRPRSGVAGEAQRPRSAWAGARGPAPRPPVATRLLAPGRPGRPPGNVSSLRGRCPSFRRPAARAR